MSDLEALERKIAARAQLQADAAETQMQAIARASDHGAEFAVWLPDYASTKIGIYQNLDANRLAWVKPDWFAFLPQTPAFAFRRSNGTVITPTKMFTDGGSIPRFAQILADYSPWGYAPAYLIHDFEFDAHHSGTSDKSFEEVRDTLVEGLKTLMETGLCPKSMSAFFAISEAVNSPIARRYWDSKPGKTLPGV